MTKFCAQSQQHIKHHTHAGQGLAFEGAARLVGIDNDFGVRHLGGWQMVIGNEHLHAQALGCGDPLETGNAVVNRDEHICARGFHALGNGGRQAVAIDHPVGHDVTDVLGAQHAQTAKTDRAGGSAVAIVVGHNAQL